MDLRFRLAVSNHPTPSDITKQLFLATVNDPTPQFRMDMPSSDPGCDAERKRFGMLLRSYVDQWIDTGVSLDGTEDLTERGLFRNEWFERRRLRPDAVNKLAALDAAPFAVLEVFQQKPSAAFVSADGVEITFLTYEPKMEHAPLSDLAEREAKRFFVWFLASELRTKLGKCRVCGRYEIKSRKFYKRGTHCRGCMAKKSAGQITQRKRQDLLRKRKEALAAVLKSKSGIVDLKDLATRKRLADEVNRRLKSEKGISSKWVKRNSTDSRLRPTDQP